MRFYTRAFLFTFVPIVLVLGLSFLMVHHYVESTVRDGLRNSLRQSQRNVAQLRDQNSLQNSQILKAFSTNENLKEAVRSATKAPGDASVLEQNSLVSGGELLADTAAFPASTDNSSQTASEGQDGVEGSVPEDALGAQLLRFGVQAGVDFMMVTKPDGTPLAGVVRAGGGSAELVPLYVYPQPGDGGLLLFRGEPYQTGTSRMEANGVTLGYLTLGERLKLSSFATSAVLLHDNWVMQSDIDKSKLTGIGSKLGQCKEHRECSLEMNGVEWLSLPILEGSKAAGWTLYSLVNVDDAIAPIHSVLRRIFVCVSLLSIGVTLLCSFAWSRAIVRPIEAMVSHLHVAARTGKLPEFEANISDVQEIRELAGSYNSAAVSVRRAQVELNEAYLEFVYSLTNALDARDCYTAGHSKRVSDLSCAIARTMGQSEEDIDRLRVGALLHDIGKIGIGDSVLQHPGKLTKTQFQTIMKHPLIGRRILQGVNGFAMYLPAVESHHENWDGSGYPKRQCGKETALDARIIHVADAYDAMTSDRSYRKGMTHDRAMDILAENAGTQFDPDVVAALFRISDLARVDAAEAGVMPWSRGPLQSPLARAVEPANDVVESAPQDHNALQAFDVTPDATLPVC